MVLIRAWFVCSESRSLKKIRLYAPTHGNCLSDLTNFIYLKNTPYCFKHEWQLTFKSKWVFLGKGIVEVLAS